MNDNIYISTIAFNGISIQNILKQAEINKLNIEFSSGLPYNSEMENIFGKASVKRLPHNYFPAPEIPFVLNLASKNEDIRRKSIEMCKHGLRLAKNAGSNFYAAHAGFCIDPDPRQLGKQLYVDVSIEKESHWKIFISSIQEVLILAEQLKINFLIENNVIASFNLTPKKENPLLGCTSEELLKLSSEINNELFGILLDTAHLKVSCQTLGLNPQRELQQLIPIIKAVHHSDNDGYKDTNDCIDENYWCNNLLFHFKDITNVIEVKNIDLAQIKNQIILLEKFLTDES